MFGHRWRWVFDFTDAFDNNPTQYLDSDGDGYGNNQSANATQSDAFSAMELNGMILMVMDMETTNTALKVTISLMIQTDGRIVMKME